VAQRAPLQAVRPGRVPPHNLDAEQSVLGAMLESKEAIANVLEILRAEDFYKPAHGEVYETILALYGRGEAPDAITVAEELARRGTIESIGGKPYIHGLLEAYPTASSAAHYARIVEEHALLRRLVDAGNKVQEIGFSIPEDVADALDQAEEIIYDVGDRRLRDDIQPIRQLLTQNMESIEKLYERGEHITGLASGFPDLDEMTAGFQPSNLIIVAARPSLGKSSLLNDFALHAATRRQTPVVIFTLEMSRHELVQRFLSSEAKVDSQRIRRGSLQEQDWTRLSSALGRLAEAPIFIDDSANITLMEMRAKCRRLKAKHGLGMVIVDYMQLMQSPRRSENRQQEVSEISRNLKILARELEIPVIVASQLNRQLEYRADKRPLLADLRESGCLTGETLIALASGETVPISTLVGKRPEVVTLDGWHTSVCDTSKVWRTGRKQVFRLKTATGRVIRATGNHRFRVLDGWRRLDEFEAGDRIAAARNYPDNSLATPWDAPRIVLLAHLIGDGCYASRQPLHYTSGSEANITAVETAARQAFGISGKRVVQENWQHLYLSAGANKWHPNPLRVWLRELGIDGQRSKEKVVPSPIFTLPAAQIALFLRHLWATDGSVFLRTPGKKGRKVSIYYATSSWTLAVQVQHLLARLEIVARVKTVTKQGYGLSYHVHVYGRTDQLRFAELIGGHGSREQSIKRALPLLRGTKANTNADTIPIEVWDRVKERMRAMGISQRAMAALRGTTYGGTSHFKFCPSRQVLEQYAGLLDDRELKEIASSDVYWDIVTSIEPDGIEDVYDMTVPGTHNFIANGLITHNSLEQDSDLVILLYRDDVYNPDSEHRGEAEVIVAKHRNGPTGTVRLAFMNQYTKFASIAKGPTH
jgi:replicative DNA helicase